MHIVKTTFFVLLMSMLPVFTVGCPGLLPGSRAYSPLPQWEAKFFRQARRDVFPDDVRQRSADFSKTLVAWTGVITNIDSRREGSSSVVRFTAKHHYFDWIEDRGVQREIFFLSPRGEGAFAAAWGVDTPESQKFVDQFAVGDMLVAYGYPSLIRNNVVGLFPTQNIRAIKPQWFRTDVIDYGRPGEPSKVLKTVY